MVNSYVKYRLGIHTIEFGELFFWRLPSALSLCPHTNGHGVNHPHYMTKSMHYDNMQFIHEILWLLIQIKT